MKLWFNCFIIRKGFLEQCKEKHVKQGVGCVPRVPTTNVEMVSDWPRDCHWIIRWSLAEGVVWVPRVHSSYTQYESDPEKNKSFCPIPKAVGNFSWQRSTLTNSSSHSFRSTNGYVAKIPLQNWISLWESSAQFLVWRQPTHITFTTAHMYIKWFKMLPNYALRSAHC